MRSLALFLALLFFDASAPGDRGDANIMAGKVDVLKYDIRLAVHPRDSAIEGETTIRFRALVKLESIDLNLEGLNVSQCTLDGKPVDFQRHEGILHLGGFPALGNGTLHEVAVTYGGRPDDGLIIGTNKYGRFTAFSDNWPNRARRWFPGVDHPSDKAQAQFEITVPNEFEAIANGTAVEVRPSTTDPTTTYVFEMDTQTPTYCMVVGVARFAITKTTAESGLPLYYYTFPEDSAVAAFGFRHVPDIIHYYDSLFGPYPFSKLALVQSSTIFGGMENSSAIFLPEKGSSYTAGHDDEMTVAHEIAHQWFGDDVTEKNWKDLWLSEGFATYFSACYEGSRQGKGAYQKIIDHLRTDYKANSPADVPVVDTTYQSLMDLLNYENYTKAALFLDALRRKVGDENFFRGVRVYYETYKHSNATTEDFQNVMEKASGQDLKTLFEQWLYTAGLPR